MLPCGLGLQPQVVPQLGLCVTLYEVLDVEGGAVHVGEGCALYTVKFSMARSPRPPFALLPFTPALTGLLLPLRRRGADGEGAE